MQYTAILAEQSLIESHVPFELVFDRDLADLSRYNVLVLPNSTCLSDAQLAAIRRFVRQGGGLVAIGQAGLYDQWRRARTTPGLAGLVDGQPLGGHYEEEATLEYRDAGAASRKEAGKGRAAYLPGLRFDGPLPEIGSYVTFNNRFFRRPANYRDLADAVRWAAGDALPVKIDGPTYLVANLVSQPEKRRSLLHLVNYSRNVDAHQGRDYCLPRPPRQFSFSRPTVRPAGCASGPTAHFSFRRSGRTRLP